MCLWTGEMSGVQNSFYNASSNLYEQVSFTVALQYASPVVSLLRALFYLILKTTMRWALLSPFIDEEPEAREMKVSLIVSKCEGRMWIQASVIWKSTFD